MNNKKKKSGETPIKLPSVHDPNFTNRLVDELKFPSSNTDPEGWYTGVPEAKDEKAIQDADDL